MVSKQEKKLNVLRHEWRNMADKGWTPGNIEMQLSRRINNFAAMATGGDRKKAIDLILSPAWPAPVASAAAAAAVIRHAADAKRNDEHATDELIEEVQIPAWAMVAFQTDRPQLLAAQTPKGDMAAADVTLLVNLIRVVMETNQSLRQRMAATELKLEQAQQAIDGVQNGIRELLTKLK